MIYATKSFLVPEKQQWKASQKVSRDLGTIIFSGRTGQRVFTVQCFSDHGKEKIQEWKEKKLWEKEGKGNSRWNVLIFLRIPSWDCRDSSNSNYFEMSEVNKMKSWNASRSWKWDIKLLKTLTFLQENDFLFYFKLNISAGIHKFLLTCTRYALMQWNILIHKYNQFINWCIQNKF